MHSKTLNRKIGRLDGEDMTPWGAASERTPVPYIGWWWREVNFDADGYRFGIIPGEFCGFMENNKWDYSYTRETTPEEWANIKELLVQLVNDPTEDNSKLVWDAIQSIAGEIPDRCPVRVIKGGMIQSCGQEMGHDGDCWFGVRTEDLQDTADAIRRLNGTD